MGIYQKKRKKKTKKKKKEKEKQKEINGYIPNNFNMKYTKSSFKINYSHLGASLKNSYTSWVDLH